MLLLMRDVLDKLLCDRDDEALGRVDAIVAELRDDAPPRVTELQLGFVPLARRIGPRTARLVEALHRRWSVRRAARFGIPWSKVVKHDRHQITVDVVADETPARDWDRWLRRNVIGRIPGSGPD